mmetsp:Transcript_2718/g.10398  ORF Transcript_2718/g.10398 Transcript_2718/m.10398 type:complete len:208 (+) Transcript_2718:308-931(+)
MVCLFPERSKAVMRVSTAKRASAAFLRPSSSFSNSESAAAWNRSRTPGPKLPNASFSVIQNPSESRTSFVCSCLKKSHHVVRGGAGGIFSSPPPRPSASSHASSPPSETCGTSRKSLFFTPNASTPASNTATVSASHAAKASSAMRTVLNSTLLFSGFSVGSKTFPTFSSVAASRANHPTVSNDGAKGTTPNNEIFPCVGRNPKTPQ